MLNLYYLFYDTEEKKRFEVLPAAENSCELNSFVC